MKKEENALVIAGVIIAVFGFLYFSQQGDYQSRMERDRRDTRTTVVAEQTQFPPIEESLAEGRKRTGSLMMGGIDSGSFTITELPGLKTRVMLTFRDTSKTLSPYIAGGSCAKLRRSMYDLNSVVTGKSETILAVHFDTIVHAEGGAALVAGSACADIK